MNISRWHHVKKILFFVVSITLLSELIGTIYFTYILSNTKPLWQAIYTGAFQAISSFCNAGLTLLPAETVDTPAIIIPTSFLVYLGGFGFIPLYELTQYVWHKIQKKRYIISLYTSVIIRTSTALLLGTTILFWIIEKNNILINMPMPAQFIEALLYSINFKSAGFLVPNPTHLQYQTILLMLCIAFIGSSPGSMGSGIKISTFAVIIAIIKATIIGKKAVVIRERTINTNQIRKAVSISILSFVWIILITFCLLMSEPTIPFTNLFFAAISASSNLGADFGVATHASHIGKLLLTASMLMGKIGTISFIIAIKNGGKNKLPEIKYPQEELLLG